MIRALDIKRKGHWDGVAADHVVLAYDDRYRRRMTMTGIGGLGFVLDLEKATVLGDGDALVLSDDRLIAVVAAAEPLLEVRCKDAEHLARIAWHIGNRHLAADINGDRILIREDHVIAEMLKGLGASVTSVTTPFNPELGAYDHHNHAHAHSDTPDYKGHSHG